MPIDPNAPKFNAAKLEDREPVRHVLPKDTLGTAAFFTALNDEDGFKW